MTAAPKPCPCAACGEARERLRATRRYWRAWMECADGTRRDNCPECEGEGRPRCPDCDGSGFADVRRCTGICRRCHGGGEVPCLTEGCDGGVVDVPLSACEECGHLVPEDDTGDCHDHINEAVRAGLSLEVTT